VSNFVECSLLIGIQCDIFHNQSQMVIDYAHIFYGLVVPVLDRKAVLYRLSRPADAASIGGLLHSEAPLAHHIKLLKALEEIGLAAEQVLEAGQQLDLFFPRKGGPDLLQGAVEAGI